MRTRMTSEKGTNTATYKTLPGPRFTSDEEIAFVERLACSSSACICSTRGDRL